MQPFSSVVYRSQAQDFLDSLIESDSNYSLQVAAFEKVVKMLPKLGVAVDRAPLVIRRLDVPPTTKNGMESLAFHYRLKRPIIEVSHIEFSSESMQFRFYDDTSKTEDGSDD